MEQKDETKPLTESDPHAQEYHDPFGPDPKDIPDPMPEGLQPSPSVQRAYEKSDPMEGEGPTG
jgi:hypothetical protein